MLLRLSLTLFGWDNSTKLATLTEDGRFVNYIRAYVGEVFPLLFNQQTNQKTEPDSNQIQTEYDIQELILSCSVFNVSTI